MDLYHDPLHRGDVISIEICEEPSNKTLPHHTTHIDSKSTTQLATEHIHTFAHNHVFPYTTISWIKLYTLYAGIFWGSVALLWHFNNSHGNMENEVTDPHDWYISSEFNTWSSMAYMLPVPFVSIPMKLPLISLAVSSFCLWSDSGSLCRFIDVTSIHWVIISVMIQKTTSPYRYNTGHVVNLVFVGFIGYFIEISQYVPIVQFYSTYMTYTIGLVTAINMCMTFNTFGFRRNIIVGSGICFLGFWCKFRDIDHGDPWGTGMFHILTAFGIAIVLLPTKPIKPSAEII